LASAVPFWATKPPKVVTIEVHLTQAHLLERGKGRELEDGESERDRKRV